MQKDYFSKKSSHYESDSKRVDNVKNIADAIVQQSNYKKSDVILDFGSGTGLLSGYISQYVGTIIANDISSSMNKKLAQKIDEKRFSCTMKILPQNICTSSLALEPLDGIISSMSIHHVQDVALLMERFYGLLKRGASIALADLEPEDGTFHSEDMGVFHYGFDKEEFLALAKKVGFVNLQIKTVSIAQKTQGDFPIFLLTGNKP